MNLEEYNKMQIAIFKKYKVCCKTTNERIHFYKLCSKISFYRNETLNLTTMKKIIKLVKKNKECD